MATVNVYVPDELKERLEGKPQLNLSSIARECWESALSRFDLPENKQAIDARDDDGNPIELRFTGTLIVRSDITKTDLYLLRAEDNAWSEDEVLEVGQEGSWNSVPMSDVKYETLWNLLKDNAAIADACKALGIKRVVQL
jgi:hypothetical protein